MVYCYVLDWFKTQEKIMSAEIQRNPHIVLLTSPGMGHLIPFCEFAHKLSSEFQCQVTFLVFSSFTTSPRSAQYLENLTSTSSTSLKLIEIPLPFNDKNMGTMEHLRWTLEVTQDYVKEVLHSLHNSPSPPSAFIVDLFCLHTKEYVATLGIPFYLFFTSSASFLNVKFWAHVLASQISVCLKDLEFGIQLPGLPTLFAKDFPEPMDYHPSHPWFLGFIEYYKYMQGVDGILVNTFQGIEESAIKAFNRIWKPSTSKSDVLAIGPMVSPYLRKTKLQSEENGTRNISQWLDSKGKESVVFVSFGSGATLTRKQIHEIALALERSGENFLWVVKRKKDETNKRVSQDYMGNGKSSMENMEEDFPLGFLERTRDFGIVVTSWAPQLDILCHVSVGGFVTHCGWNSVMESLFCGVPVIPWPLFAEQPINRVLVKEWGVGIDLKMDEDEDGGVFVKSEELEKSVRELMRGDSGKGARKLVKELMKGARSAVVQGGSSWNDMAAFVRMVSG